MAFSLLQVRVLAHFSAVLIRHGRKCAPLLLFISFVLLSHICCCFYILSRFKFIVVFPLSLVVYILLYAKFLFFPTQPKRRCHSALPLISSYLYLPFFLIVLGVYYPLFLVSVMAGGDRKKSPSLWFKNILLAHYRNGSKFCF